MLGRNRFSRHTAIACTALALAATACGREGATTGPSGTSSKDFAANLRLVSGDQQLGAMGSALSQPIVVKVVDAGGQPVAGAAVTFSVRAGGGSINPAANISDANGLVSSTWTMGTSLGENKAVALLTNQFLLDSALFKATATTGPAADLTKVSGDAQIAVANTALALPVIVRVKDAFGNNLSGVRVTWTPATNNGSVTFLTDTTAADGTASASWKVGTIAPTSQQLTARISTAAATPVVFTATTTVSAGRRLTVTTAPAATARVSSSAGTITVLVSDEFNNPVPGVPITWNDSIVGGGTLSTNVGVTSATGFASTTWTLGRRAGNQLVRARLTGRTETVTHTATATVAFWEVLAGNFMSCGIEATTNNVYCWGAGEDGQLGKGVNRTVSSISTAVTIGGDSTTGPFLTVRQLTGGQNSYCALSVARQVYCWGRTPGTSGVTNTASLLTLTDPRQQLLPATITAGLEHFCYIDLSGVGICTGTNFAGQLGDGSFVSPGVGTYPFISPALGWSAIAAGKQHTCAFRKFVSAATVNNLVPYCWGLNDVGQVGNGAITDVNVATQITIPLGLPTAYDTTSLAVGGSHSCVLDAVGNAYCWGSNGFGQLGTGAVASATARDTVIRAVAMPAGVVFRKIYAGANHTCAVSTSGAAFCWGRNDYGQLGDAGSTNAIGPVAVAGGLVFRSLSIGEFFTCGIAGSGSGVAPPALIPGAPSQLPGTVWCWGDNLFGQLGQATTGNNSPTRVPTKVLFQP